MISRRRLSSGLAANPVNRRGAFMVVAVFGLVLTVGFVAFSVDIGIISLMRTKMQSAVDSAALAAAMEITAAVQTAPPDETNITAYARGAAAQKAADVALLNGIYVDPQTDVTFGSRIYNQNTRQFATNWSIGPNDAANVVKVVARKENSDMSQPDARLRLFFAGIFGQHAASLRSEAVAYVEARDIVVVHDFSRSMNFDSYFAEEASTSLADSEIIANLQAVYDDLQPLNLGNLGFTPQWLTVSQTNPNLSVKFRYAACDVTSAHPLKSVKLKFSGNSSQTFNASGLTGTFAGTGNYSGRNIETVWVTATVPEQVPQSASVSQSGSPSISGSYTGNRQSVSLNASSSWNRVEIRFTDGSTQTFSTTSKSGTYAGTGGNSGKELSSVRVRYSSSWRNWINAPAVTYSTEYTDQTFQFDDSNEVVKTAFNLNSVSYPYPSGSWDEYIDFCRSNTGLGNKGLREMYGGQTFVQYLLRSKSAHSQTPALATTRHYPFHAIKMGHNLLCNFLENLGFNDYIGMVSYDTSHRIESVQNGDGIPAVDISAKPLCNDYQAVNNLMLYKQAAHYNPSTNIGGGMRDAITLLDNYGRPGARPNIVLMTDGNSNVSDGSTSLPYGYNSWFDGYDGVGSTYNISFDSPSNNELTARRQLLYEVNQAVAKGYTVHTIAVGADADWRTLQAIAFYGKGTAAYVPGGTSVEEMQAGLLAAFHKIAGLVPPAKLLSPTAP